MRHKALYLILFVSGSALALIKVLLVARLAGPTDFGKYTLLLISAAILSYINSLGVFEAFLIRLNSARNSTADRMAFRDSGLVFSFVISVVTASAAIMVYRASGRTSDSGLVLALCLGLFVANNLFNGLMAQTHAVQRSVTYAVGIVVKSFVPSMLLLIFSPASLAPILALEIAGIAVVVVYLLYETGVPRRAHLSRRHLQQLIREGAPFTANSAMINVATNADKWAIGFALSANELGLYAFAAQAVSIGMAFVAMTQIYVYPRLVTRTADDSGLPGVLRYVGLISLASGITAAIAFSFLLWLAVHIVPAMFPHFRPALDLLPPLAFAAVIIASNHSELFFRITSRGGTNLVIQIVTSSLMIGAYVMLAWLGAGLYDYALIFATGRAAQAIAAYTVAWYLARCERVERNL